MIHAVTVTTGARLHFGLYAFGESQTRQYGGMGAMIDLPLTLHAQRCGGRDGFRGVGSTSSRAVEFAERWARTLLADSASPDPIVQQVQQALRAGERASLRLSAAPAPHSGLGSGTQLGLAVSTALFRLLGGDVPSLDRCASAVGRGLRSAVGTYGFFYGGMIVDSGKRSSESVSPLSCRLTMPSPWRWVLIRPHELEGLSGEQERFAFERLPAVSQTESDRLRRMIVEEVLPAVQMGRYGDFAESLYEYGRRAGEIFAPIQGGPYRNGSVSRWIERLRNWGWNGVGQSSWGPSIYVICPDLDRAQALADQVGRFDDLAQVAVVANRTERFELHTEHDAAQTECDSQPPTHRTRQNSARASEKLGFGTQG